ncbi:putative esterase [Rhodococcus ruber BKS 20-38]|uniref:Putative esterase n=1 Tax=Rhodococcus ruber BKS 20-38 TaxID=1278076 RepID=M2Y2C9_9NOCA|nr:alpha/beta hydrolase [Rhodococcus ruber]EME67241.1 putative esterase [Rhodococcus ruber BKS 20-38]
MTTTPPSEPGDLDECTAPHRPGIPHRPAPLHRRHFPGASVQAQLLARSLQLTLRPVLSLWARASGLPWPTNLIESVGNLLPPIEGTRCRPATLPRCGALWVQARDVGTDRVVLYLHGGAFLCCGLRTHRRLVSRISAEAQAPVLMVDYRMLPTHTIDDAIADSIDGYRLLLAAGYRPEQIVIAGDSAGGYLSFMVPLRLREAHLPAPAAVVALSPLTELDPARKLAHPNADRCALLPATTAAELSRLARHLDAHRATDPHAPARLCPIDHDLRGMPPTLIQVGSDELLLPDAETMAYRLAAVGIDCELQIWDRQVHVFQAAADLLPESRRAIAEIGHFIRSAVPARAPGAVRPDGTSGCPA